MDKTFYTSLRSPVEPVPLPGDKTGYVRVMTGAERLSWVQSVEEKKDGSFGLLARCICDESGKRIFSDDENDLAIISGMEVTLIDPLRNAAMKINGLSSEGQAEAKKN